MGTHLDHQLISEHHQRIDFRKSLKTSNDSQLDIEVLNENNKGVDNQSHLQYGFLEWSNHLSNSDSTNPLVQPNPMSTLR